MKRLEIEVELPDAVLALAEAVKDHYKPGVDLFEWALASVVPDGAFSTARRQMGYRQDFFHSFDRRWNTGWRPPSNTFWAGNNEGKVQHAMDRQAAGLGPIMD